MWDDERLLDEISKGFFRFWFKFFYWYNIENIFYTSIDFWGIFVDNQVGSTEAHSWEWNRIPYCRTWQCIDKGWWVFGFIETLNEFHTNRISFLYKLAILKMLIDLEKIFFWHIADWCKRVLAQILVEFDISEGIKPGEDKCYKPSPKCTRTLGEILKCLVNTSFSIESIRSILQLIEIIPECVSNWERNLL